LGRRGTPPCTAMGRLLVVHHTTSPRLQVLLEAVLSGAGDEAIQDVTVLARSALAATAIDVLGADGYLLGTPANLGYMSGALKHFLDQIYYPCLEATVGRPYGRYVRGDSDTTGAVRAVEAIARGLGWRRAQAPVAVLGDPSREDLQACWELGAAMAAGLTCLPADLVRPGRGGATVSPHTMQVPRPRVARGASGVQEPPRWRRPCCWAPEMQRLSAADRRRAAAVAGSGRPQDKGALRPVTGVPFVIDLAEPVGQLEPLPAPPEASMVPTPSVPRAPGLANGGCSGEAARGANLDGAVGRRHRRPGLDQVAWWWPRMRRLAA
jgi:hypothetical protein